MRHIYAIATLPLGLMAAQALAQPTFTNRLDLVAATTASGVCMGATDMNGDGRDDLPVLDQSRSLRVFYQNIDGRFVPFDYGMVSPSEEQWGMAIADLNNDGHKDVYSGGYYDDVHVQWITAPGVWTSTNLGGYLFMQCASLGDMDSNGWLDAMGCDDNSAPKVWRNNAGTLVADMSVDFNTNPPSDMSGNYGSVFTDFDGDGDIDFYLAHCRQGVNDPNDPRRWDRLFVNDGTGHFTDQAAAHGVLNTWQTWAVDFGDWDNDGDLDLVTVNHDRDMQFMENDGTGHFSEISDNSLDLTGFLLEVHMEDLDNDGFLDILVAGGTHYVLQGHGDGTFTRVEGLFFNGGKPMHSFAIGDLNNDGAMDVWASYGNGYTSPDPGHPDQLWMNDGNANHWLNVKLEGVESNRDAIGARVVLTTPLGTQVREVRAGESYGLTNTAMCHFGLGMDTEIDAVTIHWPSGQVDTYSGIEADQNITFVEGRCIAPVVGIASANGFSICDQNGSTLTLDASTTAGSLTWSTGETTTAITIDTPGYYTVTADAGNGCTATNSVFISTAGGELPTISVAGATDLCPGDQVVLTSSPAGSYAWSNGATTQSIEVDTPGDYYVTVVDGCPDLTSGTVTVTLLPAPEAPTSADVSIPAPGTAELMASSPDVLWYDVATGGDPVGIGSPWTTPFVAGDASFWCAQPGESATGVLFGGMTDHAPDGPTENSNMYFPIINAAEPFLLKSVKVYAQTAGVRTIALVQWPGAAVVSQATYDLPLGESRVQLDLTIPAGAYGLRVLDNDPQLTYDYNTSYPYPLGDNAAIVGCSSGNLSSTTTFYFELFYDWEVEVTTTGCPSARTEVHVFVGPTGVDAVDVAAPSVYPVPAHDRLSIRFGALSGPVDVDLVDPTGRPVRSRRMIAGAGVQQLDLTGLAPGGYSLRIRNAEGITVRHIVVD